MTIGIVDFLALADSMAAQSQKLAEKMGTGVELDTASLGAQNNIDRIMAPLAPDVVADLLEPFQDQLGKMTTYPNSYSEHTVGMTALNRHTGGINSYLTAATERVAPEFKWAIEMLAIESLDPANTFSPVVDPMDTVTVTGLNSATWVHIADIDIEEYYAANLILEKTSVAGAPDGIAVEITLTKWDGTTEDKIVNVDAGDAIGTKDDIGAHPGDKYIGAELKSITCGAGSAGEAWKVISKLERTVSL